MAETMRCLVQLPQDLHRQLTAIAAAEGRSLHSQLLVMLRRAVADRQLPIIRPHCAAKAPRLYRIGRLD